MARRGQTDDVWDAVAAAWYPRGVPRGRKLHTEISGAVEALRDQGATGEEITLWVINCRAAQKATKDTDAWPKSGCTLHSCVKHWTTFAPAPTQLLSYRFELWQDGLPEEVRAYINFHKDETRFCWLGAVGKSLSGDLKKAARTAWSGMELATRHRDSLKGGKYVLLRDEVNRVLAKYLPGGKQEATNDDGN